MTFENGGACSRSSRQLFSGVAGLVPGMKQANGPHLKSGVEQLGRWSRLVHYMSSKAGLSLHAGDGKRARSRTHHGECDLAD